MKKILFLFVNLFTIAAFAQDIKVPTSLNVTEATYKLDGVDRNGFDIILQGEEKDILNDWAKYMESKFQLKLKTKGGMANGEEFLNTQWSDKQFAIQSTVIKDASGPHLRVWMQFGADIFISSSAYPNEAANLKAVMREFSKEYYVGIFQKQLDDQNKTITSQGKEVTNLNEDKAKDEKMIAKTESKIAGAEKSKAKYEAAIKKYQEKIVEADDEIRKNREKISAIRGDVTKTAAELEKEQQEYQRVSQEQEAIKAKIAAIRAL